MDSVWVLPASDEVSELKGMIAEEGAYPAFPVNISINEIAAHYTPEEGDASTLGEEDVVKVDFGIEVNGAISDTAYTIDLGGKHGELVAAAEPAEEPLDPWVVSHGFLVIPPNHTSPQANAPSVSLATSTAPAESSR